MNKYGFDKKDFVKEKRGFKPCSSKMCDGDGYLFAKYRNEKLGLGRTFGCLCRKFDGGTLKTWDESFSKDYILEVKGGPAPVKPNYQDKD